MKEKSRRCIGRNVDLMMSTPLKSIGELEPREHPISVEELPKTKEPTKTEMQYVVKALELIHQHSEGSFRQLDLKGPLDLNKIRRRLNAAFSNDCGRPYEVITKLSNWSGIPAKVLEKWEDTGRKKK